MGKLKTKKGLSLFTVQNVKKVSRYLSNLVVVQIDKASGRSCIACPWFYENIWYDKTFPVDTDEVHFTRTGRSVKEEVGFLRNAYKKFGWDAVGSWHPGSICFARLLPKAKDLLVTCDEVYAKKGTCCRARPINPYFNHPLRIVYRRAGAVMNFLVQNMPPERQFAVFSAKEVKQRLLHAASEAKLRYGSSHQWAISTGDLSNMYDELDLQQSKQTSSWLLDGAQKWLNERLPVREYSVHRRIKGLVLPRRTHSDDERDDYVVISRDMVQSICNFDDDNTVFCFKGVVFRRLLGVPMGGFISPHKAIGTCSKREQIWKDLSIFLELVIVVMRYMDDVLLVAAYSTPEELEKVKLLWRYIAGDGDGELFGYPSPLKLNVEPWGRQVFLEMIISSVGPELVIGLYNKVYEGLADGNPALTRLPDIYGRNTNQEVAKLVQGHLHRMFDLLWDRKQARLGAYKLWKETREAGYNTSVMKTALGRLIRSFEYTRPRVARMCKEIRDVFGD